MNALQLQWLAPPAQVPGVGWLNPGDVFTIGAEQGQSLVSQGKAEPAASKASAKSTATTKAEEV